jgi:hypothetical protein
MELEAKRQAEALRLSATELEVIAGLYEHASKITAQRLEDEAATAKLAQRKREDTEADARGRTDLAFALSGKTPEEQLKLKIADAQRRSETASARAMRDDTTDEEKTGYRVEVQEITAEIVALSDQLFALGNAAKKATDDAKNNVQSEARAKKKSEEKRRAAVEVAEAEYKFSKMSPDEQLAAIAGRQREIMGKKGWEKNINARAEMLDLNKKRDEALRSKEQATPKHKPAGGNEGKELGVEDLFAAYYRNRPSGSGRVIRMAGSTVGGYVDAKGVHRMAGSTAGSFHDRLLPSAFARTKAELASKREGISRSAMGKTGEEQPVDIGSTATNYLRVMAKALSQEA